VFSALRLLVSIRHCWPLLLILTSEGLTIGALDQMLHVRNERVNILGVKADFFVGSNSIPLSNILECSYLVGTESVSYDLTWVSTYNSIIRNILCCYRVGGDYRSIANEDSVQYC